MLSFPYISEKVNSNLDEHLILWRLTENYFYQLNTLLSLHDLWEIAVWWQLILIVDGKVSLEGKVRLLERDLLILGIGLIWRSTCFLKWNSILSLSLLLALSIFPSLSIFSLIHTSISLTQKHTHTRIYIHAIHHVKRKKLFAHQF